MMLLRDYQSLNHKECKRINNAVFEFGNFAEQIEYMGHDYNRWSIRQFDRYHSALAWRFLGNVFDFVTFIEQLLCALGHGLSMLTYPLKGIETVLLFVVTSGESVSERKQSILKECKFHTDFPALNLVDDEINTLRMASYDRGLKYLTFLFDCLVKEPLLSPLPESRNDKLKAIFLRGMRLLGAALILPLCVMRQAIDVFLSNTIALPLAVLGSGLSRAVSILLRLPLILGDWKNQKKGEEVIDPLDAACDAPLPPTRVLTSKPKLPLVHDETNTHSVEIEENTARMKP